MNGFILDASAILAYLEDEMSGLLSLGCKVSAFGHDLAILAGQLRPMTKFLGLSLGDRACLALGWQLGLPILTADKQWMQIKMNELKIVSIR